MPKLIDIFESRRTDLYTNAPTTDSAPLPQSFPQLLSTPTFLGKDKIKEDELLAPDSVSRDRQLIVIEQFEEAFKGQRFLDRQIQLQGGNTWSQTRNYRKENIIEHTTDITLHKERHGFDFSVQSLESNLLGGYENDGKLQGETSDAVQVTGGPVHIRLTQRGGMLNERFGLLGLAKINASNRILAAIDNFFQPVNDFISGIRGRIGDGTIADRPEIEYDYLAKIYDQNKALQTDRALTHGQPYTNVVDGQTYTDRELFESGVTVGARRNIGKVSNNRRIRRFNIDLSDLFDSYITIADNFIDSLLDKLPTVKRGIFQIDLGDLANTLIPDLSDLALVRNLSRTFDDIDSIIANVLDFQSFQISEGYESVNLISLYTNPKGKSNLEQQRIAGNQIRADVEEEISQAESNKKIYVSQVQNYLNRNARLSIGSGVTGGTIVPPVNGADADPKSLLPRGRYLKNFTYGDLLHRKSSIFSDKDDFADSLDVLFKTSDKVVRFRAFIEDISENVTPSYNENKYLGRYETFYTYSKVVRDLSFKLTLQAFSKSEIASVIKRMSYLTSLAYPTNTNNYLTPNILQITIGRIYNEQPCLVQGISHTIENDSSWDVDDQYPMRIIANIKVRLLDKEAYEVNEQGLYAGLGMENTLDDFTNVFGIGSSVLSQIQLDPPANRIINSNNLNATNTAKKLFG